MVSSTPRPHFTPRKDPVPILHEAGWAPGPVWTGRKSCPHRDSIPDSPACSQSLYRLSYPAHTFCVIYLKKKKTLINKFIYIYINKCLYNEQTNAKLINILLYRSLLHCPYMFRCYCVIFRELVVSTCSVTEVFEYCIDNTF